MLVVPLCHWFASRKISPFPLTLAPWSRPGTFFPSGGAVRPLKHQRPRGRGETGVASLLVHNRCLSADTDHRLLWNPGLAPVPTPPPGWEESTRFYNSPNEKRSICPPKVTSQGTTVNGAKGDDIHPTQWESGR